MDQFLSRVTVQPNTDDFPTDAQTQGAATTCSSICAVRFGVEGVMGLQNGELQVVEVGDLKTKDAGRWRIDVRPIPRTSCACRLLMTLQEDHPAAMGGTSRLIFCFPFLKVRGSK